MNDDFTTSACSSGGCSSCASSCGPAEFATERPLGKITAILADLGLEVTYAYDDLVFVQHSAFLLQFTDEASTLRLFTNSECDPKEANEIASQLVLEFDRVGFIVEPSGKYGLTENEDETLKIEFLGFRK